MCSLHLCGELSWKFVIEKCRKRQEKCSSAVPSLSASVPGAARKTAFLVAMAPALTAGGKQIALGLHWYFRQMLAD